MRHWVPLLLLLSTLPALAEDLCFGFLNSHPDRAQIPQTQAEEIQKGHLEHMGNMAKAGRLLAAGPLMDAGTMRGIVVYRCSALEEAAAWTAKDPAVVNKRLTLDLHLWRGPNNFGEPLASQLKIDPTAKYEMTKLPLILFRKTSSWTSAGPSDILAEQRAEVRKLQDKLRTSGPFLNSKELAEIWVMKDMPLEQATSLAQSMPLVRSGYATAQTLTWFVADESIPKP